MRPLHPVTVSVLAALALAPVQAAQKNPPRAAARQVQPKTQVAQPRAQNPKAPKPNVGDQMLLNLQNMSPEEREKALSKLPPAQRARIANRIQNFQNLAPAAQERQLDQLRRLNSLPLQRQQEVRQSMRDRNALPDDRKKAVNQELRRMTNMTDEDRQAHMNSDDFRNRFSPGEQQMIGNLNELLPGKQ